MNDEQAFADLPDAERTLLWAMRVWVIGQCRQQDVSARIDAALKKHGADRALGYLEGFMFALSRGVRRPIEVLCLCRAEVSADERRLLDAFSLLQQDEADEAETLLGELITDNATSAAMRSAEGLAQELLDAGLVLPWCPGQVALRPAAEPPQRVLH